MLHLSTAIFLYIFANANTEQKVNVFYNNYYL